MDIKKQCARVWENRARCLETHPVLPGFLILMLVISACRSDNRPSMEQIENARLAAIQIRENLYVPESAELLVEDIATSGRNTTMVSPECIAVGIDMAYLSPDDYPEVQNTYRSELLDTGWESYVRNGDYESFKLNSQVILVINPVPLSSMTLFIPPLTDIPGQTSTVYYLMLVYYEPSRDHCSG